MVQLHAQLRSRIYGNPLHLIPLASIDGVVFPPGPINLAVKEPLAAGLIHQLLCDLLNVLGSILGSDQHRILCADNDQIIDANGSNKLVFAPDIGIFRRQQFRIADYCIAIVVLLTQFRQRTPGTDIAPACIHWYHHSVFRFFHDCVVNRFGRALQKGDIPNPHEVQIPCLCVHRSSAS